MEGASSGPILALRVDGNGVVMRQEDLRAATRADAFCERPGGRFARATRLVILSRGHAAKALAWTRWAMTHPGLTLNATKTCLRAPFATAPTPVKNGLTLPDGMDRRPDM